MLNGVDCHIRKFLKEYEIHKMKIQRSKLEPPYSLESSTAPVRCCLHLGDEIVLICRGGFRWGGGGAPGARPP